MNDSYLGGTLRTRTPCVAGRPPARSARSTAVRPRDCAGPPTTAHRSSRDTPPPWCRYGRHPHRSARTPARTPRLLGFGELGSAQVLGAQVDDRGDAHARHPPGTRRVTGRHRATAFPRCRRAGSCAHPARAGADRAPAPIPVASALSVTFVVIAHPPGPAANRGTRARPLAGADGRGLVRRQTPGGQRVPLSPTTPASRPAAAPRTVPPAPPHTHARKVSRTPRPGRHGPACPCPGDGTPRARPARRPARSRP